MGSAVPTVFRLLGPLEAAVGGRVVDLGAPKQRALLAELLLQRGDVVPRSGLIDSLWGESPPDSAAASLQVYVHGLRRALGGERIETRGTGYRIRLEPGELDLDQFERLVERGTRALREGAVAPAAEDFRAALALRAGAPLADLREQPVGAAAAGIEERIVEAVELLGEAELALGHHEGVLPELVRAIAEHPYRERLREHQILALYRSGRHADALDAYRAARGALDELGIVPGPALRDLERAVLRHDESLAASAPAPPPFVQLPQVPTSLVGRRLEVAAVTATLRRSDVRLVTLTGPGGTGKTRLALAVADELAPDLSEGAAFVDLAAVADPALVPATIGAALGLRDATVADLVEQLRGRSLLLVIDNFEQVVAGATVVSSLLAEARRVRVLVTSRVALRLQGEHEYRVAPLPTPERSLPTFDEVAANDAVQLFVARARAVDPDFTLTESNLAFVAEICRELDGLPLAIELAAARTRLLSAEAIVERLGRALDLFSGGARDLPSRQQTLRAALDWSYRLLTEDEQLLFARLSAFNGGFALPAATFVSGDDEADLLEGLSVLVEGSLVRRLEREGEPRFGMLETVRAYATECLDRSGEGEEVRRRHADHFLAVAEEAAVELVLVTASAGLLDALSAEHDNFRAALGTFARVGDVRAHARLAIALHQFWIVRGHYGEGRAAFERAILDVGESDPAFRAAVLVHGATLPFRQGDNARAKALWKEALTWYEPLGDLDGISRTRAELASVAITTGDLDAAAAGFLECCSLFVRLGNRARLAVALANLAEIEILRGDVPAAARYNEEATALQRELGDRGGLAISLQNLSRIRLLLGELDEAEALLCESIELAHELGYQEVLGYAFATASEIAFAMGAPERAARLIGASDALFRASGAELLQGGAEHEGYERTVEGLSLQLGEQRLAELRELGGGSSLDEMIESAAR
jgi:predicted ATPase/DNA-binding SARP family transcriptional activator